MSDAMEDALRRWWPMLVAVVGLAVSWGAWTAEMRTLSTQVIELKAHYSAAMREDRDLIVKITALQVEVARLREEVARLSARERRAEGI